MLESCLRLVYTTCSWVDESRGCSPSRTRRRERRTGLMRETEADLKEYVEAGAGIHVIRGSENCRGWNNIRYKVGLSSKNVGAKKLSMNVATIPPGGVAFAHIHVDFEVMLYILQGRVRHEYGPQ